MNYFEKMQFLKENTFHSKKSIFNKRDILICLLSIIIGISVGYLAQALKLIINFVTNFFYFGKDFVAIAIIFFIVPHKGKSRILLQCRKTDNTFGSFQSWRFHFINYKKCMVSEKYINI